MINWKKYPKKKILGTGDSIVVSRPDGTTINFDSPISVDNSGNATFSGNVTIQGDLDVDGASQLDGTLTVGVDDTGYDVKFYGDTSDKYMLWDASADQLNVAGSAIFSEQVSAGTHFKLQTGGKLYTNSSNVTLQSASGSYLGFNISTSEKMRLDDTGLGIGTTSPSYLLTVDSSSSSGPDNVAFFNSASNNERILIGSVNQYIEHKGSEQRITLASEGSAGTFTVRTNGSERARITSDGRLGISETTPEGLLHVYNPNDSGVTRTSVFEHRYGVNDLSQYARYGIIVKSADVTPSLGITNQNYNSVIQSFLYASPFTAKDIALQTLGGSVLIGRNATSGTTEGRLTIKGFGDTSSTNSLAIQNSSSTTVSTIKDDGSATFSQLGIGTTSPSEILNLAGNNPNIRIDDTSAASRSELNSDISWYDSTGAQGSYIGHFQSANLEIRSTAGDVSIGTFAGTQIYIDGANTGIGTTSPAHKLNVVSSNDSTAVGIDIGSNAKFDFAANSSSNYSTLFFMDDVGLDIGHDSTSRALNFKTGSADRLTITGGGNVGLGTTSPDSLLEISSSSTSDFLKLTSAGSSANPIKLVFEKAAGQEGIIEYNRNGDLEIYNTDGDGGVMISGSASADPDFYISHAGASTFKSTLTVGEDDTGHDVIFYGATTGRYMQWDESADSLLLKDNVKLLFGNQPGGDLQIYHDTNNSYIDDAGTGSLNIRSNSIVAGKYTGEVLFRGTADGAFEAFHDNSVKLSTTNTGIDVSGEIEMDKSLTMAHISDPSDPASGHSVMWSDTSGNLKIKINVAGSVVTRTLAAYED